MRTGLGTLALIWIGCGAAAAPPPAGSERGACRPDGCELGLECWSARCVRPPPADCVLVARQLAPYRLGNYATPEEIAPVVATIAADCQRQQITAREGQCLLQARGEEELVACPRLVIDELVARAAAAKAPPEPSPEPYVPTGDSVFPPDPWGDDVPNAGSCDRYAAALESLAGCPALPWPTRWAEGKLLRSLRDGWRVAPAANRAALEAGCGPQAESTERMLTALGCG